MLVDYQVKKIGDVLKLEYGKPLAKEDRVVRAESYVKFFKQIELGEMDLKAGAGELTLTVPEMPGDEGIEFRLLMFQRILQTE